MKDSKIDCKSSRIANSLVIGFWDKINTEGLILSVDWVGRNQQSILFSVILRSSSAQEHAALPQKFSPRNFLWIPKNYFTSRLSGRWYVNLLHWLVFSNEIVNWSGMIFGLTVFWRSRNMALVLQSHMFHVVPRFLIILVQQVVFSFSLWHSRIFLNPCLKTSYFPFFFLLESHVSLTCKRTDMEAALKTSTSALLLTFVNRSVELLQS